MDGWLVGFVDYRKERDVEAKTLSPLNSRSVATAR